MRDRARRLIVHADDLGLSPGVTRGILEAHAAGVVTSASAVGNAPWLDDAACAARVAPSLDVGVHLNLVQGRPLERVPTLVDRRTGAFLSLGALARRALAGRVDVGEVSAECAAQIARVRGVGIEPSHLDGHRHAHVLPGIWPGVAEAARAARIRVVRVPVERSLGATWRPGAGVKRLALAAAWRVASRRAPAPDHADHFAGIALMGGRRTLPRLLRLLDALPPGTTELMVHPGRADRALAAVDPYTWQRERELEALLSAALRARLARADIELVTFRELGRATRDDSQ
ncbi:MAG TPA: ChbG/HpnK family deacetylase [Gemmatimonadaceae bacterium]